MTTRAPRPRELAPHEREGVDRTEFTLAADKRETYFSYYWSKITPLGQVAIVYVMSRIMTTLIMFSFAANQEATWQTNERPDYWEFANIWDAEWYWRIAMNGYPSELPINEDGRVGENAWAFMPVYPFLIRAIMVITGLPFEYISVAISLIAGYFAAYFFYRLLLHVLDKDTAMFAVVLFCVMPTSVMFQVGYAESLHALLLIILLKQLVERQFVLMIPVILIASFTRPTGLAWAMTLVLYFGYRWLRDRRAQERFPVAQRVEVFIAGTVAVIAGFGWLLAAWFVTGSPSAYLDTEFAWRIHYTGDGPHWPFTAWPQAGQFWANFFWGESLNSDDMAVTPILGTVLAVLIVLAIFAGLMLPVAKRLGIEIRLWLISYFTYLVAVFFPQSSVFRLMMPLFPSLGVVALPRSPLYRVLMVVASLVGQVGWIWLCWYVIGADWTPA